MFVRFVLRVDVAAEIRHQLIEIAVRLQDVVVAVRLFGGECTAADLVDDAAQVMIAFDVAQRVVAVAAKFFHLFNGVAEDKAVVRADFFQNFDVRAVQRTHAERAVEGELHVAGARCLCACQ